LFREYVAHGIHHILTGYDHLLFISALVLAAVSVWDLVKVVTAFTLAHTITLTLAALRLVHVSSLIVEPMIAASIVFVAAQNVFWPKQVRGWGRLAVAFGFGLFHGLGFAGGLLDAMQEMSGLTILLAILAFSLGVELGHQMIVIPLFGALKLARHTRQELPARDQVSLLAQQYGSVVICCAGMYYLVYAVTSALTLRAAS
jgi:hydrogenase/urease accessory protein HupE